MKYYHGSPIKDIYRLLPSVSPLAENDGERVYLTTNAVVATLYSVKLFEYTYGYGENKDVVILEEYYKDAIKDAYSEKRGYLYECVNEVEVEPYKIPNVYTAKSEADVVCVEVIGDVYNRLLEYEKAGKLIIKRYETLTAEEKRRIFTTATEEILAKNLLSVDSDYARYMRENYPDSFDAALKSIYCNK